MRAGWAFPLRRSRSQVHGFGRFLAFQAGSWWWLDPNPALQSHWRSFSAREGTVNCCWWSLSWVLDRHKLTGFYLNSFAMDSVQVGKAVFVKVSFASLGFEPRTFSYPGSCATNTLLAKKIVPWLQVMQMMKVFELRTAQDTVGHIFQICWRLTCIGHILTFNTHTPDMRHNTGKLLLNGLKLNVIGLIGYLMIWELFWEESNGVPASFYGSSAISTSSRPYLETVTHWTNLTLTRWEEQRIILICIGVRHLN